MMPIIENPAYISAGMFVLPQNIEVNRSKPIRFTPITFILSVISVVFLLFVCPQEHTQWLQNSLQEKSFYK